MFPDRYLSYSVKSKQITDVFNKFSGNRSKIYPKNFLAFLDQSMINNITYYSDDYKSFSKYGSLSLKGHPSLKDISNSFQKKYSIYAVGGHGEPSNAYLGDKTDTIFTLFPADNVNSVNSPFLTISGCNVGGWYIKPSSWIEKNFETKIFTNNNLRVMVLGAPHQVCADRTGNDFFSQALPALMQGKSLAEAYSGKNVCEPDDALIYGDPTFHFNFK